MGRMLYPRTPQLQREPEPRIDTTETPPSRRLGAPPLSGYCVDPPGAGHTLQLMLTSVVELDASAHHVAAHRLADENLARFGKVTDALGDGHRQTTKVVAAYLHLAGVHPRPQVQSDALGTRHDLGGTKKRSPSGVEHGQKAIPRRFHLVSPMARQCGSHQGVVAVGESGPLAWTHLSLVLSRSYDVGEQHGGELDLAFGPAAGTCQELLDLVHQGVGVTHEK